MRTLLIEILRWEVFHLSELKLENIGVREFSMFLPVTVYLITYTNLEVYIFVAKDIYKSNEATKVTHSSNMSYVISLRSMI